MKHQVLKLEYLVPEQRFLLIVACSQLKDPDPAPLPAFERYSGVNFRVLHKAHREGLLPPNLDILILSAKFGLFSSHTPIPTYDFKMDKHRALTLQASVSASLDQHLRSTPYTQIFLNLGRIYLLTIAHSNELPILRERTIFASGGIGQKMSHMKSWLLSLSSLQPAALHRK